MIFVRLLPAIFTTLLFVAHFSRSENDFLAIIVLLLLGTLFIRKEMVLRVWQIFLGFTGLVWINVGIGYIQPRMATNASWTRLGLIMAGIVLFSFFSAWWVGRPKIKAFYRTTEGSD